MTNFILIPHKCVVDSNVSINITSRKSDAFAGLPPKTLVNGIKHLARHWKTNGQEMTRQRHPALTTAKGPRMAKKPIPKASKSAKPTNAQIIAELTRAECAFQLRTIVYVMGEG